MTRNRKRSVLVILGALLIFSLCSCSSSEAGRGSAYTVNGHGRDYIIDPDNGTIFDGTYTYQYDLYIGSSDYSIEITYPDGSTYWWRARTSGGVTTGGGGWSDDYDANRYVDGRILCDVLEEKVPRTTGDITVFLIFILLAGGIFNIIWPRVAWYLGYGWRLKDAEPSNLALTMNRIGGVFAIIAAIIMCFA